MSFKSSFEATGEAMIATAEGNQLIAEEIARQIKNLFAKMTAWVKHRPAIAK